MTKGQPTNDTLKMNESITPDRIIDALEYGEYVGFCTACGFEQDGCEPDAERCRCDWCDERAVYGANLLLSKHFA